MANHTDETKKSEKPKSPLPQNKYSGGHTEELVDHYWGSMSYVNGLIKASEIKAGLILSFYGILLNFMYQSSNSFEADFQYNIVFYIIIGLWFLMTALSIYYCIRCFIPKIEGDYDDNVFFFGDVISKFGNIKEFARTFYKISLDEEQLFQQLGEQIFIISKIAAWKFKNVKRAILFLAIGLVLLFLAGLYYILFSL